MKPLLGKLNGLNNSPFSKSAWVLSTVLYCIRRSLPTLAHAIWTDTSALPSIILTVSILYSSLSRTPQVGNFVIIVNVVFQYILIFPIVLHKFMLVDVKLIFSQYFRGTNM